MKLPVMRCDTGCGDCCGPVPVTAKELHQVVEYARQHNVTPLEQGVTCPFYQGGKCSVHPVRPLVCRLFGHSEKMPCSRGYNVNLPERKVQRMVRHNGPPAHLLHETLGPEANQRALREIERLVDGVTQEQHARTSSFESVRR